MRPGEDSSAFNVLLFRACKEMRELALDKELFSGTGSHFDCCRFPDVGECDTDNERLTDSRNATSGARCMVSLDFVGHPSALILSHLPLHSCCLPCGLGQLSASEKYLPFSLVSRSFHFFELALHRLPLKDSDEYKAQPKEGNSRSEINHPSFAESNPIFKVCYSLLCAIAGTCSAFGEVG
jgi:hypothetical protein